MRVTVQIDDERPGADSAQQDTGPAAAVTSAGSPSAGGTSGGPDPGTPDGGAAAGPSAELAARAARLGAISAGPAPSGPPDALGAPGFRIEGLGPQASGSPGAPAGAAADHSAGPAPMSEEGP
jgi:hypothetical protein